MPPSPSSPDERPAMPRHALNACRVLIACLALAACGADGPPEKPISTGITLSGETQVGVVVK